MLIFSFHPCLLFLYLPTTQQELFLGSRNFVTLGAHQAPHHLCRLISVCRVGT
jgi:hypothetical protein